MMNLLVGQSVIAEMVMEQAVPDSGAATELSSLTVTTGSLGADSTIWSRSA
jgi:hypothetical protein